MIAQALRNFRASRRRHTRLQGDWSSDVCSSDRSEEHTSELQSPCNLVCRLLLGSEEHTSELQSPCNPVCRLLLGSEEHTSELQSPCNLVCRLLLEKKKNKHLPPVSDDLRPTSPRTWWSPCQRAAPPMERMSPSTVAEPSQWRCFVVFFFFNDTATTEIYPLSLHDALPIWTLDFAGNPRVQGPDIDIGAYE